MLRGRNSLSASRAQCLHGRAVSVPCSAVDHSVRRSTPRGRLAASPNPSAVLAGNVADRFYYVRGGRAFWSSRVFCFWPRSACDNPRTSAEVLLYCGVLSSCLLICGLLLYRPLLKGRATVSGGGGSGRHAPAERFGGAPHILLGAMAYGNGDPTAFLLLTAKLPRPC